MFDRKYDPSQPYRYATYGRMSSHRQNPRSPDQQFFTIEEVRERNRYPWVPVASYRDDGISGRYVRKRPGLQRLLRDIELGIIQIDLIVVDTMERLGRADEIAEVRRKLFVEHGVLVVAGDNNFADPTGVVGAAVGMVEQVRSTENTRVARHNVLRGKKDAARRRRWPGGPPPFGYRLKKLLDETVNPPEVYSVLELEPEAAAALRLAFHRAAETGEGDLRLAQWWNRCPDVPAKFKPISPYTMGYRLENKIATGTYVYGVDRTAVVNDTRVIESNPDGPLVVEGFCEPVIDRDTFDRVRQVRVARAAASAAGRARPPGPCDTGKKIAPQIRGLTLKYPLSGLVRCASCGSSMRPVTSGRKSKGGKAYTYYARPRYNDRACGNGRHVAEDRLRAAVLDRLRARLFPPPDRAGDVPDWLPELTAEVRREVERRRSFEPDRAAVERDERRQLEASLAGWGQSLGNPSLPTTVRSDLETRYAAARQRLTEIDRSAASAAAAAEHLEAAVGPAAVLAQLKKLTDVLSAHNPTLMNLELGKHVDRVLCHPNGRVELRGTWLGVFGGGAELLSRSDAASAAAPAAGEFKAVNPRRRGRLRIPSLSAESQDQAGDSDTALDPTRFEGLAGAFFWTDPIVLEDVKCWSETAAAEVARKRADGLTHAELAAHFGVTPPTIRKALRRAAELDPAARDLPRKQPRARWPEQHFREVDDLRRQGKLLKELCAYFGKSEPLIRTALRLAEAETGGDAGSDPPATQPAE